MRVHELMQILAECSEMAEVWVEGTNGDVSEIEDVHDLGKRVIIDTPFRGE